ncbi:Wzz/FepE/Etk N-terminal domain-containing protein [Neobacillus drentensis]|uniref:YveK family protein n=1 Tax=Neobacillus drentensis TaxID=220684 RepID=UPI0030033FF9
MKETISIMDLLQTLKKRLNLILAITLVFILFSGILSYFILTPVYQSSTQILVNQAKNEESLYNYNEVQTNLQLINTYTVIIKSPAILDKVIKDLDLKMTTRELNEKISIQSENDSQVINIGVLDSNPRRAAKIVNKTAEVFESEIGKIMNVKNVSILAKADLGEKQSPIKPKPLINIGIALIVGLMVGVGIAFLIEYLDNSIKTEQDIEKTLELPVLGTIAAMDESKPEKKNSKSESRLRGETVGF